MQNRISQSRHTLFLWGTVGVALIFWMTGAWVVTNYVQVARTQTLIKSSTSIVNQQANNITDSITHDFEALYGIPSVVARDGEILRSLSRFAANTYPDAREVKQRKEIWSADSKLKTVNGYLNSLGTSLGVDVIYLMNTAGDCIASSNSDKKDSFVGANYSSREYFRKAMHAVPGHQYSVGKTSKIPGFYFSSPVVAEGRIVGVVASKINVLTLEHWVNQSDAFVTDQYGVIILASDIKLEMRALADARIDSLGKDERMARYQRDKFPRLAVNAWTDSFHAPLRRFDDENQPVLLADKTLEKYGINIHVYKRLPEIVGFEQDRLRLFFLLCLSGALAILFIGNRISYNHNRKQTERALRDSEELLREAQTIAGLGSYVLDIPTGTWKRSSQLNRLLGLDETDLTESGGYAELIHPDDRAMIDSYLKNEVLAQGKVFDKEYRIIRHNDKDVRWVHGLGKVVFDARGNPLKLQCTIQDITKRVQIQDELRHARDAAETANQTKSTFLANMSHELRTPLNAIIGYSEMLEEDAQSEGRTDLVQDLQKIHSAGKHLLELINDVLDLSKIEAGKIELYPEHIDLADTMQQLASTMQTLIEKNGNTLQMHLADGLGLAYTDQTKLRQILLNLLSNACKFTERGMITLNAEREIRDGVDWLIFSVSDSGIGMTAEQIGRLFQAFSQADASTTRKYGGTGLGLMISRHFCQMLGGDITVTSTEGCGSTFTARVLANLPQTVKTVTEPTHPAQAEIVTDFRATVLAIDDDENARDLLRRLLGKEGLRVECAAGGIEGLQRALSLHPDLITLDAMMPDKDGWTVLSELKANPETADIPVIMLTMMDNQSLGFSLGAADYLNKPVSRERLLETVGKHLSHREGPILIVEDDDASRQMLHRALENWTVVEAGNGLVALDRIAEKIPALILLDLMMPEMDGFQLIEALRQHDIWRTIPVVIITAKDLSQDDRDRLKGSVLKIVQKGSYNDSDLMDQVLRLVSTAKK